MAAEWVNATGEDVSDGWMHAMPSCWQRPSRISPTLIERNPNDWDAYLRRAEANHALNEREAATLDYTKAIELHPPPRRSCIFAGAVTTPRASCAIARCAISNGLFRWYRRPSLRTTTSPPNSTVCNQASMPDALICTYRDAQRAIATAPARS